MIVCPFCGLASEVPHETQAACIEALQAEISRVREIVGSPPAGEERAAPPKLGAEPVPPPSRGQ
jgi:hypothetical protein